MIRDKVRAALIAERETGLTIKEIAERHRVSAPYICTILKDTVKLGKVTCEKVETMFPGCELLLPNERKAAGSPLGVQNNNIMNGNAIQRIMVEQEQNKVVEAEKRKVLNAFKVAANAAILETEGIPEESRMALIRAIHAIHA